MSFRRNTQFKPLYGALKPFLKSTHSTHVPQLLIADANRVAEHPEAFVVADDDSQKVYLKHVWDKRFGEWQPPPCSSVLSPLGLPAMPAPQPKQPRERKQRAAGGDGDDGGGDKGDAGLCCKLFVVLVLLALTGLLALVTVEHGNLARLVVEVRALFEQTAGVFSPTRVASVARDAAAGGS
jgi:hypothetical protein